MRRRNGDNRGRKLGIFGQKEEEEEVEEEKVGCRKEGRKGMGAAKRNLRALGAGLCNVKSGGVVVYAVLFLNLTTG